MIRYFLIRSKGVCMDFVSFFCSFERVWKNLLILKGFFNVNLYFCKEVRNNKGGCLRMGEVGG